jgi:hypothetical protein
MKTLLLFALLGTLVACKSETKEQKCTLNGTPISCETSNTDTLRVSKPIVLKAVSHGDITYDDTTLEMISSDEEVTQETINGKEYKCTSSIDEGSKATYKISNGKLIFTFMVETDSGIKTQTEKYDRLEGEGDELIGSWTKKNIKFKGVTLNMTLKFDDRSMTSTVECRFH